MRRLVGLMMLVLLFAGCGAPPEQGDEGMRDAGGGGDGGTTDPPGGGVALERISGSFKQPLLLTHDERGHLIVLEKEGKVLLQRAAGGAWDVWLDLSGVVSTDSERGVLGLAVDPADPNRVFVSYTNGDGDSVLSRWQRGPTLGGEVILMEVPQPANNHNGGHIAFGPDGMLYWGLGDGGLRDDAYQNGQNKQTLLGTILRLDVSGSGATAPPDNPFVGDPTGRDEIWVWGLRNPWRFSFGPDGALWIGDVGQDEWEEIDRQDPDSDGGENYGWPAYEGTHQYRGLSIDHELPVAEYANAGADCSVTGGHVATDAAVPGLAGAYVLGDFCSGRMWTLRADGGGWDMRDLMDTGHQISSFGTDGEGSLYIVDFGGKVLRFVAAATSEP